jgi:membrane protease YdiL (CAAX protease family)
LTDFENVQHDAIGAPAVARAQVSSTGAPRLTLGRLFAFYLIFTLLGPALWLYMGWLGLYDGRAIFIDGDYHAIFFVPLAYLFDRSIFVDFWRFPVRAWRGILFLLGLQYMIVSIFGTAAPPRYQLVGILFIAPVVEELARAVSVHTLETRMDRFWVVLFTSFFWALAHEQFWIPMLQQTVLTTIFVKSRKSIPVTITAHFLMNGLAVTYPRLHALFPHAFV